MKYFIFIFLLLSACQSTQPSRDFVVHNTRTIYLPLEFQWESRLPSVAAPLYTEDKIIAGNAYDGLKVFNKENLKKIWQKKIRGGLESGFVAKGSRLYFGASDYYFYALNIESGMEIWRQKVEGEILGDPVLEDSKIYFITSTNTVYCLNAKDGEQVWRYKRSLEQEFTVRGASSPLLHKNRIYLGFSDGFFASLRKKDGSLIWERQINTNSKFKDIDADALIDGEQIFISGFDSKLYSLSIDSGQILWSLDHGGVYAPAVYKDSLYYPTSDGKLLAIEKNSGKVLHSWETEGIFRKPLIEENYLIVGSSTGPLLFIDTINHKTLGSFHPGMGLSSPVISIDKNKVAFISGGSNLYEISYTWKKRGLR